MSLLLNIKTSFSDVSAVSRKGAASAAPWLGVRVTEVVEMSAIAFPYQNRDEFSAPERMKTSDSSAS
jgi:hypothetical protein